MRKILSLLLLLVVVTAQMSFVHAELAGSGMKIEVVEDDKGIITGTVTMVGAITNYAGFEVRVNYDASKVSVLKSDKITTADMRGNSSWATGEGMYPDILNYFYLAHTSIATEALWNKTSTAVAATYIRFGNATLNDTRAISAGDKLKVGEFYFKKAEGKEIDASTFTFVATVVSFNKGTSSVYVGDAPGEFDFSVTPYDEPTLNPDMVLDETNADSTLDDHGPTTDIAPLDVNAGAGVDQVSIYGVAKEFADTGALNDISAFDSFGIKVDSKLFPALATVAGSAGVDTDRAYKLLANGQYTVVLKNLKSMKNGDVRRVVAYESIGGTVFEVGTVLYIQN